VEIELPPPLDMRLVGVPQTDDPPRYYPEVVAAFEQLGFRRIGGVHLVLPDAEVDDLVRSHPAHVRDEFRESARTPETLLAAPDGTAFVGVDWFYRQPSVRLRSLLADGGLVETQRGWDHLPVPVVEMEPYADRLRLRPEQDRSAPGRRFTIVPGAGADAVWAAHQEALARASSPPVEHRRSDQAVALWQQVLDHDQAIERNVGPAYVGFLKVAVLVTAPAALALILVGIYAWASHGSAARGAPWFAAAAGVCLATALALRLVARRLTWWLRYRRRIRPTFRGTPAP
jgi:hypothetical protein